MLEVLFLYCNIEVLPCDTCYLQPSVLLSCYFSHWI